MGSPLIPLRGLLCLLLLCGCASPVWSADLVTSRAFVEDPTGHWTVADARSKALRPLNEFLTHGFGKEAVWIRLRIDPQAIDSQTAEPLYVRIRPVYLDDIQIFDDASGFSVKPPMGDRHPISEQDEWSVSFLRKISSGDRPREVWVRIESTSTRFAFIEVLTESQVRKSEFKIQLLGALFLTTMSFFLLWGIAQAVRHPEAIYRAFAAYQLVLLLNGATLLGYVRLVTNGFFATGFSDQFFSLLVVSLGASFMVWMYYLIKELRPSRKAKLMFRIGAAIYALLMILQFAGYTHETLQLNNAILIALPSIFIYVILAAKSSVDDKAGYHDAIATYSVLYYLGFTQVLTTTLAFSYFGGDALAAISMQAPLFYGLYSGLLFFGLLRRRESILNSQQVALRNEMNSACARAELESAQRKYRERMLAILAHELKTPIATMRMLLGDQAIPQNLASSFKRPLQEITLAIERTVESDQLEGGALKLSLERGRARDICRQSLDHLLADERFEVVFSDDARESIVTTDSYLVRVVLRNLTENALKYSLVDSKITIEVQVAPSADRWSIVVSNTVGRAGLPDPDKVFEKYWRSPRATYVGGTGQGLYICSKIADLLRGTLSYASQGDVVRLRLELPTE